ncbi:MAG: cyclase/dehydrase [Friedmanniella sp.]|nr:cyclase/dehydrase [Friedmanniella sp.]
MSTKVEKSILVNVPVSVAYNQWTQFEEFPQFMGGITSVTQLSDNRLEWVAEIAGVRRRWEAKILEQVPDRKVAWAATEGATNAGQVTFEDVGGGQTSVRLSLDYEPEGLVEKVGDKLNVIENQAEGDLDRFKAFIESEGYASGAWRGSVAGERSVGTPDADDADASRGDSGKAGVSGKAVAAGIGIAAAAATVAGAAAAGAKKDSEPVAPVVPEVVPQVETTPVVTSSPSPVPSTGESVPGHVMTYEEINEITEENAEPRDEGSASR